MGPSASTDIEPAFRPTPIAPSTLVADGLSTDGIQRLIRGEVLALRGRVLDPSEARAAADRVEALQLRPYDVEPAFRYLGSPLFESTTESARGRYLQDAERVSRAIRYATSPSCPLDVLLSTIRDAWPEGLRTLRIGGRNATIGIIRTLNQGAEVSAHIDDPVADSGFHPDLLSIQCTLSALIYLDMPRDGGELRLWPRRLGPGEERAARRADSAYALDESLVGPPALTIRPEPGEFLIFCASKPHAVTAFERGRRVTVSTFVNVHGADAPLSLHA